MQNFQSRHRARSFKIHIILWPTNEWLNEIPSPHVSALRYSLTMWSPKCARCSCVPRRTSSLIKGMSRRLDWTRHIRAHVNAHVCFHVFAVRWILLGPKFSIEIASLAHTHMIHSLTHARSLPSTVSRSFGRSMTYSGYSGNADDAEACEKTTHNIKLHQKLGI